MLYGTVANAVDEGRKAVLSRMIQAVVNSQETTMTSRSMLLVYFLEKVVDGVHGASHWDCCSYLALFMRSRIGFVEVLGRAHVAVVTHSCSRNGRPKLANKRTATMTEQLWTESLPLNSIRHVESILLNIACKP